MLKEIKKIKVKGFKGFEEEKEIDLYNHTIAMGENGIGKTSIGELITWAFLGCTLSGNDKADSILKNNKSKVMQVKINFLDDEDKEHELIRNRSRSTTLSLDGVPVKQTDIFHKFIGDKELFLSVFNSEYFINQDPKPARELLSRFLPRISNDEVKARMDEGFRKLIENDDFIDPNSYMKELRSEIKEWEDDKSYTEGSLDTTKEAIREIERKKGIEAEIKELEDELKALESKAYPEANEIKEEIEMLKSAKEALEEMITENKKAVENPKDYLDLEDTTELEKEVIKAESKLEIAKEQLDNIEKLDNMCPICKQEIEEGHKNKLKSSLKEEINSLNELIDSLKLDIKETQKSNEEKINFFITEKKKEIAEYQEELKGLEDTLEETRNLLKEIEETQLIRKTEIKAKVLELKSKAEQKDKLQNKVVNFEKHIKKIDKEISNLNMKIEALKHFNAKVIEIQKSYMKEHLDKVDIKLEKINKTTGEIKPCFEITYEGKDFKSLSYSERIRAGLEIIGLIKHYSGATFPVFIDNGESITHYRKPEGQVIEARVYKGLMRLQVVDNEVLKDVPLKELMELIEENPKELTLQSILLSKTA